MCLDCLDLIFFTFKPPAFRSRAYCDCNPIRAFETFDISKEPISKTSRFWMFWYKRGCNWLGAIKRMALWFPRPMKIIIIIIIIIITIYFYSAYSLRVHKRFTLIKIENRLKKIKYYLNKISKPWDQSLT